MSYPSKSTAARPEASSGSAQPEASVRLHDLEHQLKQMSKGGDTPADPLAELARFVGREDPFHTLLPKEQPANASPMPSRPEPSRPGPSPERFDTRNPLSSADIPEAESDAIASRPIVRGLGAQRRSGQTRVAPQPTSPSFESEDEPDARTLASRLEPNDVYDEEDAYEQDGYSNNLTPRSPRRSRRGIVILASVLAVVALGGAIALGLRSSNPKAPNGEPPVIAAEKGAAKIQPQNPGGIEIPDQDKQIYANADQSASAQPKVVSREEQPLDVNQAAKDNAARLAASSATPNTAAGVNTASTPSSSSTVSALGEPKKVKTVLVRPTGAVVDGASSDGAKSDPTQGKGKPDAKLPQKLQLRPADIADGEAALSGAPLQISPQASQKLPQRLVANPPATSVPPPTSASEAATETASNASSASSFTVQLSAAGSEDEAKTIFTGLQRKYPSELGDTALKVVQAEVREKTVYRLRVGELSKDDASSLCSRLKSKGGQCFVVKN